MKYPSGHFLLTTGGHQCFVFGSASICLVKIENSELFILVELNSDCCTAAILVTKPARVCGLGSCLFQMAKTSRWFCQIPPLS